jgi:hypothetical protein
MGYQLMISDDATSNGGYSMTEEQLKREAERLIATGKMPSIEKLASVVLKMRRKYANQIRRARRKAKEKE